MRGLIPILGWTMTLFIEHKRLSPGTTGWALRMIGTKVSGDPRGKRGQESWVGGQGGQKMDE